MSEFESQGNGQLEPKIEYAEIGHSVVGVLDLLHDRTRAPIQDAMQKRPDLFVQDEKALYKNLKHQKRTPTAVDNRLRLAFWQEYQRATTQNEGMKTQNLYMGVCSAEYYHTHYLNNPNKVAWLMCVPSSYEVAMKEALHFAIDQMRDILDLPLEDKKTGKINFSLAALKFRIAEKLHTIVKGSVVQKNVNVNIGQDMATDRQIQEAIMSNNMEEIQKRIKELDARDRQINTIEISAEESGVKEPSETDS
jgi:hypothetical protein